MKVASSHVPDASVLHAGLSSWRELHLMNDSRNSLNWNGIGLLDSVDRRMLNCTVLNVETPPAYGERSALGVHADKNCRSDKVSVRDSDYKSSTTQQIKFEYPARAN